MRKLLLLAVAAAALAAFFVGCSSSSNPSQMGAVTLTMSDPATCTAPQGPYSHVYVTITDALAHTSSTAGPNDSGWLDLTPNLKSNPMQVDLLAAASNQCFLATLGSNTQLQAGNYQQIRLILLANSSASSVTGNKCGSAANCVVLAADNSVHTLLLSSEAQTGIKIPSGQIAGGQFTVAAGQTVDLNIDFNTCASIVVQGNGQYRLKPVLHAGEVSTTSASINGKVVDKATGLPVVGGKTVVALEQTGAACSGAGCVSTNPIDRILMEVVPDANGNFTFCPVPPGTYDVIAVALNGSNVAYAATITTGVQPGNALGNIPLIAQTGPSTAPATVGGTVTTTTGSAAAAADISVSPLQAITGKLVTIPLTQGSSTVTTAGGASCPSNTDCADYSLTVPAMNPNIGAFSSGGTTYTQDTVSAVSYTVDALAFVVSSGGTADCSPSELQTASLKGGGSLTVTPGASFTAATLAFTGCAP